MSTLRGDCRRLRSRKSREAEARLYSLALASLAAVDVNQRPLRSPQLRILTKESDQASAAKEETPSQVDGRTLIPPHTVSASQEYAASEAASSDVAPTKQAKVADPASEKFPPWAAVAHDAASVMDLEPAVPEVGHETAAAKKVACSVPVSCVRVSKRPRVPNSPTACGSTASVVCTNELMASQSATKSAKKAKVWFELVNTLEFDYKLAANVIGENRHSGATALVNEVAREMLHPYVPLKTIKEKEKEAKRMLAIKQKEEKAKRKQSPRTKKQHCARQATWQSPRTKNEHTESQASRQSSRTKEQPTASQASRQSPLTKKQLTSLQASGQYPHLKKQPNASQSTEVIPSNLTAPVEVSDAGSVEAEGVNEPATLVNEEMLLMAASLKDVASPVSVSKAASEAIKEGGTMVVHASSEAPPEKAPDGSKSSVLPKNPSEETRFAFMKIALQDPHLVASTSAPETFSLTVVQKTASESAVANAMALEETALEAFETGKVVPPVLGLVVATTTFLDMIAGDMIESPKQMQEHRPGPSAASLEATQEKTAGTNLASMVNLEVAVNVAALPEETTSPVSIRHGVPSVVVEVESFTPPAVPPEHFASKVAALNDTVGKLRMAETEYSHLDKGAVDESKQGVIESMNVALGEASMEIQFAEDEASFEPPMENQLLPDEPLDKKAKKREYDREYRKNRMKSLTGDHQLFQKTKEAARQKQYRADFKENASTPEKEQQAEFERSRKANLRKTNRLNMPNYPYGY